MFIENISLSGSKKKKLEAVWKSIIQGIDESIVTYNLNGMDKNVPSAYILITT